MSEQPDQGTPERTASHPHDNYFCSVFSNPQDAASLLRAYVPQSLGRTLKWATLTMLPGRTSAGGSPPGAGAGPALQHPAHLQRALRRHPLGRRRPSDAAHHRDHSSPRRRRQRVPQRPAELRPPERPHRGRQGAAVRDDRRDARRHRAVQAVHGTTPASSAGSTTRCSISPTSRPPRHTRLDNGTPRICPHECGVVQ